MPDSSLLIISHTAHYLKEGKYYGWGATVREIDELADIFDNITHIAPLNRGLLSNQDDIYKRSNVVFVPAVAAGGDTVGDKIQVIFSWLKNYNLLARNIRKHTYVHLRCPANISLLALVILFFTPGKHKNVWIKYAGNWQHTNQPIAYRIQKWLLKKKFKKSFITVNGFFDGMPSHFRNFLNPSLYDEEISGNAIEKTISQPVNILFVGSFESYKGTDTIAEIVKYLHNKIAYELYISGDGSEKEKFLDACKNAGVAANVHFMGWRNKEELKELYKKAHFILLPSKGEGWPKVLSEGMAYGAIPVSSNVSCIPQVLARVQSGACFDWQDYKGFGDYMIGLANDNALWQRQSLNGIKAAALFSYSAYKKRIKEEFIAE